ncbi:MAG: Gfo/Idh/MocA family oxidoreductase [Kiritimatiellae bacterium]|nr:Gfo/Idh/MocA family oxidoreductase [Kiritimatiellia bacterium]
MSSEYHRPPIKIALLGLGRAVFFEHYPVFRQHPALFNIVAACDLEKDRRDKVLADYPNCKMFRQVPDMLAETDIDLVLVATPSKDHAAHAMACLEKGFWTLVESPLALTMEVAQFLRGAAFKAKNRLLVLQRGLLAPDFLLTKQVVSDLRLGELYDIKIRREDYIRRDDWQTVKRLGGGAVYYEMTDLIMQAIQLLPAPPIQMWSDLKRIVSLGDAEDCVRVQLKTRTLATADIEYNGGVFAENRTYSFVLRGARGNFYVKPGESKGELVVIDPKFNFPRRRSSVRTPEIEDMHEQFPVVRIPVELDKGTEYGVSAFWKYIYATVRTASPFPITLEDAIEAVKFAQLMKKNTAFAANAN